MEGISIEAAPPDIENPYIQLETSMTKELDRLSPMTPFRCIFRVPPRLRCEREQAYTPQVISIGPLHHGKQALKAMEEHKMRYLQCFMGRTHLSLMHYLKKIKDQEPKLRSCYSETIQLESHEFVRIILVDAIFIIEFLFRFRYRKEVDKNDCIFGKPCMLEDVRFDLRMLENQLPFFILEDLFDPTLFHIPSKYSHKPILFLSRYFLDDCPVFEETLGDWETINSSELGEVQHFVDLLRKCIAPILKEQSVGQSKLIIAPSIEELHLAGVKFKVGLTNNLFDIRFKDGILEIPKLMTEDRTEVIFRNLVAFEQYCISHDQERYISDYVGIMDSFVNTPKDAELLVKYGIVENLLGGGNNELSTMINSLSTGVAYDSTNFYYGALCEQLKKFCDSKWHKSMANLRHNYFNTPWATVSFVAALLLLILTAIQTICSIISLS